MIKGSTHAKHKIFIREMIAGGSESLSAMAKAYKKAYPKCKKDSTARVNGCRLLRDITIYQAIDKGLKEREEIIAKAQREELDKMARKQIASQNQLEAVLSQIALGNYQGKKLLSQFNPKTGKFATAEVAAPIEQSDQIAAADKLLKIKGAYAKDNVVQHEAGDSWIEAMKTMHKNRKK